MIIHTKYDTVNGEVGVSADFTEKEKSIVNKFRQQLIDMKEFVPSNSISDLPFSFFVASYFLSPQANVVALTCVYVGQEVLRPILSFITLKLPLNAVNPFVVAKNIMNRRIRDQLLESVKDRKYEIEIPDEFLGQRLLTIKSTELSSEIRKMQHVPESSLYGGGESVYRSFITFWPFDSKKRSSFEKMESIHQAPSRYKRPAVELTSPAIVTFEKKNSVEDEATLESYPAEQTVDEKSTVIKQPALYKPQQRKSNESIFVDKKWRQGIVSYIIVAVVIAAVIVILTNNEKKLTTNPPKVVEQNNPGQKNNKPEFSLNGDPIWLFVGEYTKGGTEKWKLFKEEKYKINGEPQMLDGKNIYYINTERPLRDIPDANVAPRKERLGNGWLFIRKEELYNDKKSPDSKRKNDSDIEARWWKIQLVKRIQ